MRMMLVALVAWSGCIAPTDPVAIGGGGGGTGGPTGAVRITVTTTGSDPDPNGYQLLFSEAESHPIEANGTLTLTVAVGSYQVTLSDLALNCAVEGSSSTQSFSVESGATTTVAFAVVCS
ncbi:MAG TPA: hypothetical protein VMM35_00625 [Longimicrobiales bacterium]|nr:hypothetical protein [Longimicrobiales bacterium]